MLTLLRWNLLIDAALAVWFARMTASKSPAWLPWEVGMVVPEIALWLAPFPLAVGVVAGLVGRGHRLMTGLTLCLCATALVLLLKPTVQAHSLGQRLPGQLAAAFGPAAPPRAPFSIRATFAPLPEPVPIETMNYSDECLLDFYRAIGRSPAPCVVVLHGGSWVGGNRLDQATSRELNDWLARRGYAVASIGYRLAPDWIWPAQRDDLLAALGFLRARAAGLGIDPTRFVLLGRSAGAQIVAAAECWRHDPGVRGVVAIYPPTDFYAIWRSSEDPGNLDHRLNLAIFLGGSPWSARPAFDSASAALLAGPGAAPMLILQGALDINVFHSQSQMLADKLAAAEVPHALVSLPWAAHAFDLVRFNSPGGQIATYAVDWFVSAVTR